MVGILYLLSSETCSCDDPRDDPCKGTLPNYFFLISYDAKGGVGTVRAMILLTSSSSLGLAETTLFVYKLKRDDYIYMYMWINTSRYI